jgi:hypothetical protein
MSARNAAAVAYDSAGNFALTIAGRDQNYTGAAEGDDVVLADVVETAFIAGVPAAEITEAIASLKAEGFLVAVHEVTDDLIGTSQAAAVRALDDVQPRTVFVNPNVFPRVALNSDVSPTLTQIANVIRTPTVTRS